MGPAKKFSLGHLRISPFENIPAQVMHGKDRSFRIRKRGDGKNTGKMIDMRVGQYNENGAVRFLPAFPDEERKLFRLLGKAPRIDQEDGIRRCDQVRVGRDVIDLPYEGKDSRTDGTRNRLPGKRV
jgi:hypothetical protein